jgi:hypothetical protein
MALVNCYECARPISDQAVICPQCGAPAARIIQPIPAGQDYFSSVTGSLRDARTAYTKDRWGYLFAEANRRGEDAVQFVFLVNSGSAVATLGFMGAMKTVDPIPTARTMLSCFLIGVVLVGVTKALNYYIHAYFFRRFKAAERSYARNEIQWAELLKLTAANPLWVHIAEITAWLSFICFLAGAAIAYRGLFL